MKISLSPFSTYLLLALATSPLTAAPRDVQFRSVDFENSVLELHNFGEDTESLNGWRFCSHDEDQTKIYSSPSGLNGISLAHGESLFIHYLGDAPSSEANRINLPGSFALPLDRGPYGIQIYFPPISFGNGGTIADHVQWAIDGVDNASAAERSDEAQNGGLWTDQGAWVATSENTNSILLTDATRARLHGPDDYRVIEEPPFELDSIEIPTSREPTLTWVATPGANYQVFRGTDLDGGTSSFGALVATVFEGTYVDPIVDQPRAFYRVTENPPVVIPYKFANEEGTSSGEGTALGDFNNTVHTVYNEAVLLASGLKVGDVLTLSLIHI